MMLRIGNKAFTPLHPESLGFQVGDERKIKIQSPKKPRPVTKPFCNGTRPLRRGVTGFTLIEVMVATAIFASGVVLVYEALFSSLDAFNYYSDYLGVVSWMDEKIWQAQDSLSNTGVFSASLQPGGEYINKNISFLWDLTYGPLDEKAGLYKIDLNVIWRRGRRQSKLSRTAYAVYTKK